MIDKKVHCLICAKDVEMNHLVSDISQHLHCTTCPCEEEETVIVTRFDKKYYICEDHEVIPSLLVYEFYMDVLAFSKEIGNILFHDVDIHPDNCRISYELANRQNNYLLECIEEFGKAINVSFLYSVWEKYKTLKQNNNV